MTSPLAHGWPSRQLPWFGFLAAFFLAASLIAAPRHYDIPSGDAATTLPRFIEQSGEQVVYLVNHVRGVTTHAVRGEFEARAALDRMLAGTELYAVQDESTQAFVINRTAPRSPSPSPTSTHRSPPRPTPRNRPPESDDAVIRLPSFTVQSGRDVSYVGKQALSTTRTGVELLDLAQSVKVINRALIDDLNPSLVVDTLKYVGGGQAGNINFADDRFVLRGFNSPADIGDFVDGFRGKTDSNTDTAIIERLEIIKGPSAIFVANGPVGGVINKIIKGPVSYDLRSVKVQVGRWDGNRAEVDLGGPVTSDGRLLYRLVLAGQSADGFYDETFSRRLIVAPSLAYDFNEHSRLTLKYNYLLYRFSSYNGLPFDERTGHRLDLDPRRHFGERSPRNWRKDIIHRVFLEYTHRPNDNLAMRLAGFANYNNAARIESVNGSSIPPTFTAGTLIPRSTTAQDREHHRRQIQADLVATFDTGPVSHRLLLGGDWADAPDIVASFAGTSSPIDPFRHRYAAGALVDISTPNNHTRTNNRQLKAFALETLSFADGRLLLSAGLSRVRARTSSRNFLTGAATPQLSVTENLKQYGAVLKLTPTVSLFAGFNENFAPNFTAQGQVLPSQIGEQTEFGLKTDLLAGRLAISIAAFDIQQANVPVLSFPQTMPPSFILVPGQTSEGWDADLTWEATKNIDLIATYANLTARARSQANSAAPVLINPVNNVAEETWGLWIRYKVTDGPLKGFSAGLGLSHLSARAITDNTNARVYGWLAPYTTADLALTYDRGPLRYGLNLENLAGVDYDAAVRNQSIIVPGAGTNVKASVTWRF
jgi:TonB-dependent siderophore receptor